MYLLAQGTESKTFFLFIRVTYNTYNTGRAKRFPFQFFRRCETFSGKIFYSKGPRLHFLEFCDSIDVEKSQKVPLSVFFALRDFFREKISQRVPNSSILRHFQILLLFLSLWYGAGSGLFRTWAGSGLFRQRSTCGIERFEEKDNWLRTKTTTQTVWKYTSTSALYAKFVSQTNEPTLHAMCHSFHSKRIILCQSHSTHFLMGYFLKQLNIHLSLSTGPLCPLWAQTSYKKTN